MNIVCTGCAGFIGSHVTERLLEDGHTITGIDNFDDFYDPSVKLDNIRKSLSHQNFKLVKGDFRDKNTLIDIFKGKNTDMVIHVGARAGIRPSIADPILYYDVNVNGTLALLEAMRNAKVTRMIFASSSSVYGNNKKIPFAEDDPVDFPISPYAASKKAGELLCHTYHHLHGFDIFCLRFFTVYGPRQRPEMAIHRFVKKIMNGEPIEVFGDGSTRRDYTYIDDIVSGVVSAVGCLKGYEIINLGESRTTALSDLITLLEKAAGKKAVINRMPEQPGDVQITNADIGKAKRILNYSPQTSIEEGIEKFIRWITVKEQRLSA